MHLWILPTPGHMLCQAYPPQKLAHRFYRGLPVKAIASLNQRSLYLYCMVGYIEAVLACFSYRRTCQDFVFQGSDAPFLRLVLIPKRQPGTRFPEPVTETAPQRTPT